MAATVLLATGMAAAPCSPAFCQPAEEQARRTIVVLSYTTRGGEGLPVDFGETIATRIAARAEESGRANVVPDSLVYLVLAKTGSASSDVTTLGRARALADSVGADTAVFGSYESFGTVVKVTSQLATPGASRLRVLEVAEHLGRKTPSEIAQAVAVGIVPLLVPAEREDRAVAPEREEIVVTGRKRPFKVGGWLSLAVAAGSVAGAVNWHLRSEDEWDKYLDSIDPPTMRRHYDDSSTYLTMRNVAFGVGTAAVLSALYHFYQKDYGATEEWAGPVPTIDLAEGQVTVALRWPLPGGG
jgi:hypothetical protein